MTEKRRYFAMIFALLAAILTGTAMSAADDLEDAKKHYSFAVQNKNNENYEEAERQYVKSLALVDTMYQVHYSYADMLFKLDRPDEAKIEFLNVLELDPANYNSAAMLAKIYYNSAAYDSSLAMYELMYEVKPESQAVITSIAALREYLGDSEGALAMYDVLFAMGAGDRDTYVKAARLADKIGQFEVVLVYTRTVLESQPEDMEVFQIAAEASIALGDQYSAIAFYRKMVEADPTNIASLEMLEGLYRGHSERENLIWTLELHHAQEPQNVAVIGELAEELYAADQMTRGLVYVQKGLDIDPDDGRFRILLGENYRTGGQEDKALEQYRLAMNDPNWNASAQQLIWQIERPESDEEIMEREFFNRGK